VSNKCIDVLKGKCCSCRRRPPIAWSISFLLHFLFITVIILKLLFVCITSFCSSWNLTYICNMHNNGHVQFHQSVDDIKLPIHPKCQNTHHLQCSTISTRLTCLTKPRIAILDFSTSQATSWNVQILYRLKLHSSKLYQFNLQWCLLLDSLLADSKHMCHTTWT